MPPIRPLAPPVSALAVLAVLLPALAGPATASQEWLNPADLQNSPTEVCARVTSRIEQIAGFPTGLLQAVALVESGRAASGDRARSAWPWTINARGRSYYYASRDEAVAAVRAFRDRGIRSVDVGCMQVNMRYHGQHFASIEEAFDPVRNVLYASRFLVNLYRESGSWRTAVGHYHSRTPEHAVPYRRRIERTWRRELGHVSEARAVFGAAADRPAAPVAAAAPSSTPPATVSAGIPRPRTIDVRSQMRAARPPGGVRVVHGNPAGGSGDAGDPPPARSAIPLLQAAALNGATGGRSTARLRGASIEILAARRMQAEGRLSPRPGSAASVPGLNRDR